MINADVNGSLNIHRKLFQNNQKEVHDAYEPVDKGLVMNPIKINLRTNYSIEFLSYLIKSL
jgi:transposase